MDRVNSNLSIIASEAGGYVSANDSATESEAMRAEFLGQVDDWVAGADGVESAARIEAARRLTDCWDLWEETLNLSGLGLSSLPACVGELYQVTRLELSGNALEELPDSLSGLENLEVMLIEENELREVPAVFHNLPRDCDIWIAGNPIPFVEVRRFDAIAATRNGPWLVNGASEESEWETLELNQSVAVPRALEAWRADLPAESIKAQPWHRAAHPHVENFGGWLTRLREVPDFKTDSGRDLISGRVAALLAAMNEDETLRELCFHCAHESVNECVDNVLLGLSRFEMLVQNRQAERGELSEAALFELGRGMFRLGKIEEIARDKVRLLNDTRRGDEPAADEVDVHLAYQVGLRDKLDLPIAARVMQFPDLPRVGALDLQRARLQVRLAEGITPRSDLRKYSALVEQFGRRSLAAPQEALRWNPLALYLARDYLPWRRHVERAFPGEAACHSERMYAALEHIEAEHAAGRINEQQYRVANDILRDVANFGLAYEKAIECLKASRTLAEAA